MRLLIIGTNWIGDAVMTIPAMRRVRRSFPDAHIALYTRRWAEGIFRDADFLDEIIAYDPQGSKLKTVREGSKRLKNAVYDAAIILPNSFESALTVRLAGIRHRIGYRTDGRGLFLSNAVRVPGWKSERHESNYYLNLVENAEQILLGKVEGSADTFSPDLSVSDTRKTKSLKLLRSLGVDTARPTIGLGAGSTNSMAKRWPAVNFAKLADKLISETNANVVLLGSENEQDVADAVKRFSTSDIVDLSGKTDLSQATSLLSVLDLFISNDMGLAHISGAVGTPTLTIFGPTNENTTRPLGEHVEIVRKDVECSPCMLRECPIDHRCMTRINPDMVFETARRMLQNR